MSTAEDSLPSSGVHLQSPGLPALTHEGRKLGLPLAGCVTLSKLTHISVSCFLCPLSEDSDTDPQGSCEQKRSSLI